MTDETNASSTEPTGPSGPTAGEAWDDVLAHMKGLGEAVSGWIQAAANEPDTKEKLDQVRAGIADIGLMADAALGRAVRSDLGHQVREGAEQASQAFSDAAQHVTQVAGPHVKSVLSGLSEVFGKAAARVDEASHRRPEPVPPVETAPPAAPPIPTDDDSEAPRRA